MELKNLKLEIIHQIVATEDFALLQTIQKLLELNTFPSALHQELPFSVQHSDAVAASNSVQDLQQSIDDIFEING